MFEKYDGDWKKVQKIVNFLRPYLPRLLFVYPLLVTFYLRLIFGENDMVAMYIVTQAIGWASLMALAFPFARNSAILLVSVLALLLFASQYSLVFIEGFDNSSYRYLINKKSLEVMEVSCDPIIRTPKSNEMLICVERYDFQRHSQKNFTQGLSIDSYEFSYSSKSVDYKFNLSFKIALNMNKYEKDLEVAIKNSIEASGRRDRELIQKAINDHLVYVKSLMESKSYEARKILEKYYLARSVPDDIEASRTKLVYEIGQAVNYGSDMFYVKNLSIIKLN